VHVQPALVVVDVEDALRWPAEEPTERTLDLRKELPLGKFGELLNAGALPLAAVVLLDLPGDLVDILPMIAIFGEIRGLAKELHVACPHGLPQKLHLPSGVVVVILSRHVVAGVL
jgi:hypothetical protein